jgi:tetratricopeptide (TPR) repeat protein
MQYENTRKPIREIASELGVDALIESSVFRAGDSVEMEVRLVDGGTQQYVAEPITRGGQLRDVMSLYRSLSSAIATEIRAALTPQAEAHLSSTRPVNPQVYDAYLKGQFHWQRMTGTDLDQALEYFQQALLLDSTYAPAHAGIALVWWMGGSTGNREAVAQASIAAREALALDSTLAEVQHAVAMVRTYLEWDWEGGEAAFRKAIEINPNYPDARAFYWGLLDIMGRREEGRAQMERALALDPFNPLFRAMNGIRLLTERRYADAIEELQAAERMGHPLATNLANAYHLTGNYDEALAQLRRSFAGDQELEEALDRGYAEGGYRAALLRCAETLAARPEAAEHLSLDVAYLYAWAGEKERTLEWLELAYQARCSGLPPALSQSADFDLVRDDPRFRDLRRWMNLPY